MTTLPTLTRNGDFDFIVGRWTVQHRRLLRRLAGGTEWQTFGGTSVAQAILGGDGTFDDNVIELPAGLYRAATLRSYDAAQQQWSIWWLDPRNPGPLDPPMKGRFEGGQGLFYADETFEGRPIRVRFIWSRLDTPQPRWEQAFSADGGLTWETNWEMDFSRDLGGHLSPPP
jgi:hypothetical protein